MIPRVARLDWRNGNGMSVTDMDDTSGCGLYLRDGLVFFLVLSLQNQYNTNTLSSIAENMQLDCDDVCAG
jgi:hypothetical protein